MNAALIARTLSLIPDRVPRAQSGSTFDPSAPACCAYPDRITHLAQFLNWLGPLNPVTKDDLRIFGLRVRASADQRDESEKSPGTAHIQVADESREERA